MVSVCECGNEHAGSIKRRDFLDLAKELLATEEGLFSMALVIPCM